MEKHTAMPIVAGILDIVHAVFGLLSFLGILIAIITISTSSAAFNFGQMWGVPGNIQAILWSIAIPFAISGILSLIGGIYALQRKKWGLALAGSIAAIFPSFIVGVAAVVLVALSKNEFE